MSNFKHPFNDSLKKILDRLEYLIKQNTFKNKLDPNYVLLDNSEILQLFKISPKTAVNWREEQILPFCQIKGKIYYKLSDIHKVIDENYISSKKKL
ncbi:helix-turn-helix domain-containing protein [Thalassobellus sediminis]|uniref:helix-turn-helix domain-containing protein n=1 Tax=Thalassobellus sediminis TaxID=3367753 RepID=UPI003798A6CB